MANWSSVTFRQLQVFSTVARLLSYTRAARSLHLTQPAISMQIKQLESNLEIKLFDQIGKKIYLTHAGKLLIEYANNIQLNLKQAEESIDNLKGVRAGTLLVAVASTVSQFATRIIAGFVRQYPGIKVNLDVTNRRVVLEHLQQNHRDIVLMGKPPRDSGLVSESFMRNPLVLIAAPDHPLANRKRIDFSALEQETFVIRELESGTRAAFFRWLDAHGYAVSDTMEMNNNEAVKHSVAAGLGLGLVSRHTIDNELNNGYLTVLNVKHLPIQRNWYVVYLRSKHLQPVALEFRRFLIAQAEKFT